MKRFSSFFIFVGLLLGAALAGCSTQDYQSPWMDPSYNPYEYDARVMERDRNFPDFQPVRPSERAGGEAPAPMSYPDENSGYLRDKVARQSGEPSHESPIYSVEEDGRIANQQGQEVGRMAMAERPAPTRQPAKQELPVVKVGVLLPLSGQSKSVGQALLNAMQLAMFDIAQANVSLVVRDTKGTPAGASDAASAAIADGAQIILGPLFSQNVKAAAPIAARHNINVIAFSTDWTAAGHNVFVMGFLPFTQVTRVVDYAASQGYHDFAGLIPKSGYGAAVANTMQKTLNRNGLSEAHIERFSPIDPNISPVVRNFTDYDTRVEKLNNRKAVLEQQNTQSAQEELRRLSNLPADPYVDFEAVMLPVGGDQARNLASLFAYFGVDTETVKLLGTGLWDDDSIYNEISLQGAWFAAPDPNLRSELERKYFATYNQRPPRLATLGYDAMALAAVLSYTGMSRDGRPAFDRAAITSPNGFAGIDGIFRFRGDGLIERGLAVLEVRRTGARVIDPAPKTFAGR